MALPLGGDGTTDRLPTTLTAPVGECSICHQEGLIVVKRRDVGDICARCSIPFLERTLDLVRESVKAAS